MFYFQLLDLIRNNANELARRASKEILTRDETKGYRKLGQDVLYDRVYDVYSTLGGWLGQDDHTVSEIRKVYTELGRKRFREGIPLNEVVLAFMLVKRVLWDFIQERQFFETTFEMGQALELNNRVVFFFDRVIYFVTMGYEEELRKNLA
ncbi:MAG TPA: hypothetical protein PLW83_04360 [Deltaproteobacteria bacterium]|nr:hypothetical protein [Deltaproteobacteria bacterium]